MLGPGRGWGQALRVELEAEDVVVVPEGGAGVRAMNEIKTSKMTATPAAPRARFFLTNSACLRSPISYFINEVAKVQHLNTEESDSTAVYIGVHQEL